MIDNHLARSARLYDHLATRRAAPPTAFRRLFKRSIGDAEYGLALVEAVAHLNHLWQGWPHHASKARRRSMGMAGKQEPIDDIMTTAEAHEASAMPMARAVHADPDARPTAESVPLPDALTCEPVDTQKPRAMGL